MDIIFERGDTFAATGTDRSGKRFKITSTTWFQIECINIWKGSKWLVRNGKKILIQRFSN